jgi:hypothetical protein
MVILAESPLNRNNSTRQKYSRSSHSDTELENLFSTLRLNAIVVQVNIPEEHRLIILKF